MSSSNRTDRTINPESTDLTGKLQWSFLGVGTIAGALVGLACRRPFLDRAF